MSVALLSQSNKSEFGIAQASSCIAGHNVLNKRTASPTAKNSIPERTYWSPTLGTGQTSGAKSQKCFWHPEVLGQLLSAKTLFVYSCKCVLLVKFGWW